MKMILSVANRKGGVGKTSVSANVAWEMQRAGKKILLLDLDSQCDLTSVFLDENDINYTIYDVLADNLKLKQAFHQITPNLFIVPGSEELADYETQWNHKLLKKKLNSKSVKKFDAVIIDHPPGKSNASEAGYLASNYVIIIIEPDSLCIKNLNQMFSYIQGVQQKNPGLKVAGIVMNKIDLRRNVTTYVYNDVIKNFSGYLFNADIGIDSAIPNALLNHLPIRELPWRSRNVTRFRDLAREIRITVGI